MYDLQLSPTMEAIYADAENLLTDASPVPSEPSDPEIQPLTTRCFDAIQSREISWLWPGLIPYRFFTLIDGIEGIGKTFMLQWLAAEQSKRGSSTLWLSLEDSPEMILKPRFESLQANTSKIHLLDGHFIFNSIGFEQLRATINALGVQLVVIDPLFSFTGKANINDQSDVRQITDALNRIADDHGCAVLGVRHVGKSKGFGDPRAAGGHSIGWVTGCRSALLVGCDADDKSIRGVAQTKLNVGAENTDVLGYTITDDGVFQWLTETPLTVERMLAFKSQAERGRPAEAISEAKEFLQTALADGPRSYRELWDQAQACENFSIETFKRAGRELGVVKTRQNFSGGWDWEMPSVSKKQYDTLGESDSLKPNENGHSAQVCQKDNTGTVGGVDTLGNTPKVLTPCVQCKDNCLADNDGFCVTCSDVKGWN